MNKAKSSEKKVGIEDFVLNILKAIWEVTLIAVRGFKNKLWKEPSFLMLYGLALIFCFIISFGKLARNYFLVNAKNPSFLAEWFYTLHDLDQFVGLSFSMTYIGLVLLGIGYSRGFKKYQLAIERAGLKSGTGEVPKIKDVIEKDEYRKKVIVETFGVGTNKFEAQKNSLITGFGENIEEIKLAKNKSLIEIHLCAEDIPERIVFDKLYRHVTKPYSFIVGKAMEGPIVKEIKSLPHMLISGTTGGGKSNFFRSTMLSLLKSSPHIQLYLLDLKRGIEVKEFSELPNVKTVKKEDDCIKYLGEIVNEMERRFDYLEKEGKKKIEPGIDDFDLIVVGIDEAAALFGKKENELAIRHISDLAKLARAAAIHLIPATQKPISKAIDTETLDNLPGRMTFKMISTPASNAATGGNHAKDLPATEGRGVWIHGSKVVEVQTPLLTDKAAMIQIKKIKQEFDDGIRKNKQELLKLEEIIEKHDAPEEIADSKEE